MDPVVYNKIVAEVANYKGLTKNCLKLLKEKFTEVNADTLHSILNIEYQRKMKLCYGKSQNNRNEFWNLYNQAVNSQEPSGILIRLSETYGIAPCLMARLILQKYFEESDNNKQEVEKEALINVNAYLKDTCLIPDADLSYEVFLCTVADNLYSPLSDAMSASLGQQYEIRLHKEAVRLGLAFRNEDYLRNHGYDKTPDIKLEVPIAVEGFVINWIESKALFADGEVHRDYLKNQYLSYWNRFGPGLIIYWFGYLSTVSETSDKRFIIRDHLPTDIRKPTIEKNH